MALLPWQIKRYERAFQAAKPGLCISHSWSLELCCRQRHPSPEGLVMLSNCVGDVARKRSSGCGFILSCLCEASSMHAYVYWWLCDRTKKLWTLAVLLAVLCVAYRRFPLPLCVCDQKSGQWNPSVGSRVMVI